MTAKLTQAEAATPATGVRLDMDIFDALAERLGATNDAEKARLVGIDRVTLWRYRNGRQQPSVDLAQRIAVALGTTVDQLFPRRAA